MAYPSSSYLSVLGHSPQNGDIEVSLDVAVEVQFSDDINIDTLTPDEFAIYQDGNIVPGGINYYSKEQTAVFTPYEKLSKNTEYKVVIDGVESISGLDLKNSYTFTFTTTVDKDLKAPTILYPSDGSVISDPKVSWTEIGLAESYFVEVSKERNFSDLLQAKTVHQRTDVNIGGLESNQEYFVRVKAENVTYDTVTDTVELDDSKIVFSDDSNQYIVLDKQYRPLENIISFEALDIKGNSYDLTSNATIESENEGKISFSAVDINIDKLVIEISYGVYKNNSKWSSPNVFYYEAEETDYQSLILNQLDKDFVTDIKPDENNKYNVDLSLGKITFTINDVVNVDDVNIEMVGNAINDIPYIESQGIVDGQLEIVKTGDSYTNFKYNIPSLYENNEYNLTVRVDDNSFDYKMFSNINPMYNTIKAVQNSDYGDFIEGIDAEQILYRLYEHSVLAEKLADMNDNSFNPEEEIPYAVRMFVLKKTIYKLLYAIYMSKTSAKSTSLGDFQVEAFEFSDIEPALKQLKSEVEFWKNSLMGLNNRGHAGPTSTQVGSYPLTDRTF